jgi:hypothetical protein
MKFNNPQFKDSFVGLIGGTIHRRINPDALRTAFACMGGVAPDYRAILRPLLAAAVDRAGFAYQEAHGLVTGVSTA